MAEISRTISRTILLGVFLGSLMIVSTQALFCDSNTNSQTESLCVSKAEKSQNVSLSDALRPNFKEISSLLGRQDSDSIIDSLASVLITRKDALSINPDSCIQLITALLFEDLGIQFDTNRNQLSSLLPQTIIESRRGSCVGLSALFMLLAGKLGLRSYGVLAPEHFFLRVVSGDTFINIDPMKDYESKSDSWYRERFAITDINTIYLKNLHPCEVSAVFDYNTGNHYLHKKDAERARKKYRAALKKLPRFAEAWGNLAVAQESSGKNKAALSSLHAARNANPGLRNIDRTIASQLFRMGKITAAHAQYRIALEMNHSDPHILYGIASCYFARGSSDSARLYLDKTIDMSPEFEMARNLLERIKVRDMTP